MSDNNNLIEQIAETFDGKITYFSDDLIKKLQPHLNKGKIYPALNSVMTEINAIAKDRVNQQQRFNFRGIDDVYNAIHPCCAKHGVFSTSTVVSAERQHFKSKSGAAGVHTTARIRYRFYTLDGSYVETEVLAEASDYGDKSYSKVMAIAHKYALLQIFMVPTQNQQEDPDAQSPEPARKKAFNKDNEKHRDHLNKKLKEMDVPEFCWDIVAEEMNGKQGEDLNDVVKEVMSVQTEPKQEAGKSANVDGEHSGISGSK